MYTMSSDQTKNDEIDLLRHQIIQTERKLKELKTILIKKVKN